MRRWAAVRDSGQAHSPAVRGSRAALIWQLCKVWTCIKTLSMGGTTSACKMCSSRKISPKLLHTESSAKPCCQLFQGTCVFNNTFSSNYQVPSRILGYVTQLLPYCTTNFLLHGSVCWNCYEVRPALLQLSTWVLKTVVKGLFYFSVSLQYQECARAPRCDWGPHPACTAPSACCAWITWFSTQVALQGASREITFCFIRWGLPKNIYIYFFFDYVVTSTVALEACISRFGASLCFIIDHG